MEQSKIEAKVLAFIRDFMDNKKIGLDTDLLNDSGADSLDIEEIAAEMEEQFEVHFDNKDIWEDGSLESGIPIISKPKEFVELVKKSLN